MFEKSANQSFLKLPLDIEQRIDDQNLARTTTVRMLEQGSITLGGIRIKGYNGVYLLVGEENEEKVEKMQTVFSRLPPRDVLTDIFLNMA